MIYGIELETTKSTTTARMELLIIRMKSECVESENCFFPMRGAVQRKGLSRVGTQN